MMALFILSLVLMLPLAWFASEFQPRRWVRLLVGSGAILACFGVAYIVGFTERFNYNAWYGGASQELIKTTISEIEKGHTDKLLVELKRLDQQFQPTYENRAHYDQLVSEFVARTKADRPNDQ